MDIAIIGMASEFGSAKNVFQYWQDAESNSRLARVSPALRWRDAPQIKQILSEYEHVLGSFLSEANNFDFLSFSDLTVEALQDMGPYAPLLLNNILQSIENAGYTRKAFPCDKCGLFLGFPSEDTYLKPTQELAKYFSLMGLVDTSTGSLSALMAVSKACRSLNNEECGMALVGGVDLCVHPNDVAKFSNAGEGVATLVLTTLPKALEDGDYVYGIIKNINVEQDWSETFSEENLSRFDHLEISGFSEYPQCNELIIDCMEKQSEPLSVDTVDEYVGTPAVTGGLAALIKVLRPVPWSSSGATVKHALIASLDSQSSCTSLEVEKPSRRTPTVRSLDERPCVVVLSAFCAKSFRTLLFRFYEYVGHLVSAPDAIALDDLAYSTQVSREALPLRIAFVANNLEELKEQVETRLSGMPGMFKALSEDNNYLQKNFGNDYSDDPFKLDISLGRIDSLRDGAPEIANLWCAGAEIRWDEFYSETSQPRRVPIPGRASNRTPIPFHTLFLQSSGQKLANPKKPRPVAFVLSAPASGSTLLQSMLRCNKQLFAPGELNWLGTESISHHEAVWKRVFPIFAAGLPIALQTFCQQAKIKNYGYFIAALKQQDMGTKDLYKLMQEHLGWITVVDKSPFYSASASILSAMESVCDDPVYIFLHRHPLSTMQSLTMEGRAINRMLNHLHSSNPWKNACELWFRMNQNALRHLSSIPDKRKVVVSYEALVTEPKKTMEALCQFLEIEFDALMLDPYAVGQIDGGGSGAWGWHKDIDRSMADKWKKYREYACFISEPARRLARDLGYHEGI